MSLVRGIPAWVFSDQGAWTQNRSIPDTEFHVHLEGSLTPSQFVLLAREHAPELLAQGENTYLKGFEFNDFSGFIDSFAQGLKSLSTLAAWEQATRLVLTNLAQQGCRRVLIFFSPMAPHRMFGIKRSDLWQCVCRASEEVADIEVAWVVDMIRHWSDEDLALDYDFIRAEAGQGLVGVGIGGPELKGTPSRFVEIFNGLRGEGILTTAHAGEGRLDAHGQSLADTINLLRPHRIGHACISGLLPTGLSSLKSWQDECGGVVDISPSSNLATQSVENLEDVPLQLFQRQGIRFTVNTDDPGFFETNLGKETSLAKKLLAGTFPGAS